MTYRVSRLALDRFRSWDSLVVDFAPGVNVLVGRNGIGKTNIVEAMEFLATGSSHRASAPRSLIQHGVTHATIRANVETVPDGPARPAEDAADDGETVSTRTLEATIPTRGALRSRVNGGPSRPFRDIVGMLRAVLFSPRDQQLVLGDPAGRRAFLDQTATMLFPDYYALRQRFRQVARQRGIVLKRLADQTDPGSLAVPASAGPSGAGSGLPAMSPRQMSLVELETWTSQFIDLGIEVTRRREEVVSRLAGTFSRICSQLSDDEAVAGISYEPSFAEVLGAEASGPVSPDSAEANPDIDIKRAISQHFQRIFPGEQARGVSLIGPQRDDVLLTLDREPAREFASNGEMWTIGLALRMAQFECLSQDGGRPVLILDDVFAQLDEERRRRIMEFARRQGQTFITVAARSDIPAEAGDDARIIDVGELAAHDGQ